MHKQLLIIGHTFPEPTTTAAGGRMMQLIGLFQEQGYTISFASTAAISKYSESLEDREITVHTIALNDAAFDTLLQDMAPDVVVFDRFITEEQFGWRVASHCPNTVRILDTEDLHFLRKARAEAYKNELPMAKANLYTDTAKRELASILRCDVSLLISEIEVALLTDIFKIPEGLLWYVPLFAPEVSKERKQQQATFETRQHFIAVGNLKHAPNVVSVRLLHKEIWPAIRQQLPKAQLQIYGAYVPQQVQEMHSPETGFLIMGWAKNISAVMQKAKVQLAPIPFGAGLKGKLVDAMQHGLPTVTTNIGAEGLFTADTAPGAIADTWEHFVEKAVVLYQNQEHWLAAQKHGYDVLARKFQKEAFANSCAQHLETLKKNIETHRQAHFIGQVMQHHTLQANKYLSKWIEAKNRD